MPYSVCVDNQNLVSVDPICINWKTPFLKLFFDKEKARNKHFAENGQNWQYSDTDYSFKTTLLDVYLDQNDHITDITLYKYQSTSFNHGKNSSKELKVTASDIKENLAVLQEVVSDSSDSELEKLLSDVSQSEFGKERKFKVGKTSISIIDQNGNVQTIKRNTILKAIQISHKYLEILHNDKVFNCSPKDFPEEIRPVLHEILSFVNAEKYYDLDALKYKKELRELVEQAEEDYPRLRQAVIDGDLAEVVKLAAYAKLRPSPDSGESALYFAVKNDNYNIVKVLLENGAYVLDIYSDGSHYPLEIAYTNGNQEMVRLLIEYHGAKDKVYSVFKHNVDNLLKICASKSDYETLNLMGPDSFQNEAGIWMKPEMFPDINNDETLRKISQYPEIRIAWKLDQIRPLYEKKDYDLCRNLLIQGSDKQVIEYFIAEDDLEMFKAALSRHTAFDAKGASFELAFERGRKWYDCLCEHTTKTLLPNGRIAYGIEKALDRYYIKLLDEEKFDQFIQSIEELNITSFTGCLGNYHTIYYPDKCIDIDGYRRFANYMLDHYSFTERYSFLECIVRYFGDEILTQKYNLKCPLRRNINSPDVDGFWKHFGLYKLLPDYIENKHATLFAGAEIIRSSFGLEPFENKGEVAVWMMGNIISVCTRNQPPLSGEEEREKRRKRAVNCMKVLLEKIDLQELDEAVKKWYKNESYNSTYDLFVDRGITYQPMLELVESR